MRSAATIEALHRLQRGRSASTRGGRGTLEESYRFCERARNARYLVTGKPGDALPGGDVAERASRA